MVLFHGTALPSRGSRRARFPTFVGTTTVLRLPARASLVAYVFASRVPMFLRYSCPPRRFRGSGGLPPSLGQLFSRRPVSGVPTRGRVRDISGFLAIHPIPLPCSQTPVEPTRPRLYRPHQCCPRSQHSEGFNAIMISGLPQGFDTCCLRFTNGVAAVHARLASGWRAARLPG